MTRGVWHLLVACSTAVLLSCGCEEIREMAKEREMKADYFVAPNGKDSWSGRLPEPNEAGTDGPFATITGARDAIRREHKKAPLQKPIMVLIRKGVYRLSEPIEFTPEDSGTEQRPITYAACPGERPIVSGGRRITGWQKGPGKLWQAEIADVKAGKWHFNQIFVNGKRQTRARTPNDDYDYLRTDGPINPLGDREKAKKDPSTKLGFRYKEGDLKPWENMEDVNIILYHSWTASLHWIAALDEKERIVRFTAPSKWPVGWWEKNQRYYVENFMEALDTPGEWYLNRKTGVLYYWPPDGADPNRSEVIAPELGRLVLFSGDPAAEKFVEHIHLEGLSFQHADWFVEGKDFADGQAGVGFLRGAIYAVAAHNCVFENCEIAHVGEYGLWLGTGCQHNLVRRCHIHDLGGGGVCIGEPPGPGNKFQADPSGTGHNVIDNNFIHDGGHVWIEGIGVIILRSSYNEATHNEICDFRYSGVSVGWSWGYAQSSANHNLIEYNHIHHLGYGVLSDMGGIYTLGVSPGTKLRYNLIHDVYSYSYGGWGLYTDEGSSEILLENNVVYNTKSGGFHQHYGRENIVRNNIFAFAWEGQIKRSRQEDHCSFTFEHNIVLGDHEEMLGGNWDNGNYKMDGNLYWNASGESTDFAGLEFSEWKEKGRGVNSLVADPMFVNAKKDDFRLKARSPALKLGFKPIDLSKVGLYGDKQWVNAPKSVQRKPMKVPPPPAKLRDIDDGFEDAPVGSHPKDAEVRGEEKGASICVSGEAAADGKHSLKFTDVPGLQHTYQPHMYYSTHLDRGIVRVSFDLRLEKDAALFHEWRDASKPYRVGPSIRVESNGDLKIRSDVLMNLPIGQWVRFEFLCGLGSGAGTYDLIVSAPGQMPKRFEKLPVNSAEWRKLRWLGFMSIADKSAVFYLDNLKVKQVDAP